MEAKQDVKAECCGCHEIRCLDTSRIHVYAFSDKLTSVDFKNAQAGVVVRGMLCTFCNRSVDYTLLGSVQETRR